MKYLIFTLLLFGQIFTVIAQQISGVVYELTERGETEPLPGVNVYWADRSEGTITSKEGYFEIKIHTDKNISLVVSYVGYKPDTIIITDIETPIEIIMSLRSTLDEVVVSGRGAGAHVMRMEPILTQKITTGELQRAACCNLAESFETNASVDVQYNDAVSGAKQVQLLGLSGVYSQILFENMPYLRGLGIPYGLEYLPGPWLESIHISKGTSSVLNGYESITGQINAELKKPESEENFFLNAYIYHLQRYEVNMNKRFVLNDDLQTMIFAHYQKNAGMTDNNKDGFLDVPLIDKFYIANHWNFHNNKNFESRFGIRALAEERKGGQTEFFKNAQNTAKFYGTEISTKRIDAFAKTGYVFKNSKNSSMGLINSISYHDMSSFFGFKTYTGEQLGYYGNFIFTTELWKPEHTLDAGFSFMFDEYSEYLNNGSISTVERVPGIFLQYTYNIPRTITLLGGLRVDNHSYFGNLVTPRFHARYMLNEFITLRASAGKGYRSPRMLSENIQILASSRNIVFEKDRFLEEAINFGGSISWDAIVFGKNLVTTLEYYHTTFQNQAIIDYERNQSEIHIYSLTGNSYASHFQIELNYYPSSQINVRAAARYNDVKITYDDVLRYKHLVDKFKFLTTAGYTSKNKNWQFDATLLVRGKSSLPDLSSYPPEYQLPEYSPVHTIVHAQITRNIKKWSFYIGAENILNYTQKNPILAYDDPFGQYFDSSIVWGPILGRKVYFGLRYKIDKAIKQDKH